VNFSPSSNNTHGAMTVTALHWRPVRRKCNKSLTIRAFRVSKWVSAGRNRAAIK
jgi:hypothetical protein